MPKHKNQIILWCSTLQIHPLWYTIENQNIYKCACPDSMKFMPQFKKKKKTSSHTSFFLVPYTYYIDYSATMKQVDFKIQWCWMKIWIAAAARPIWLFHTSAMKQLKQIKPSSYLYLRGKLDVRGDHINHCILDGI